MEIAPIDENSFTTIAEGTNPVVDGVLGTLDPSLMVNNLYTLRLTAFDRANNTAETSVIVQLEGQHKVGNFTLAFEDLNVPVAGLPIVVTRVYDSRDRTRGDFGIGWKLDIGTIELQESTTMGTDWGVATTPGPFGIGLNYILFDADLHKVSLTLPDGKVESFDLTPVPSVSQLVPLFSVAAVFTPRPGTVGGLSVVGNPGLVVSGA